jgi:hypothetical protein
MIQDREYPIRPGDIFIVNANDIHQPILCGKSNEGALVVYFSPRLFADASEGAEWLHAFMLASLLNRNRVRSTSCKALSRGQALEQKRESVNS